MMPRPETRHPMILSAAIFVFCDRNRMHTPIVGLKLARSIDQGGLLQIEYSELSLIGGREENQDRVAVVTGPEVALLITHKTLYL